MWERNRETREKERMREKDRMRERERETRKRRDRRERMREILPNICVGGMNIDCKRSAHLNSTRTGTTSFCLIKAGLPFCTIIAYKSHFQA